MVAGDQMVLMSVPTNFNLDVQDPVLSTERKTRPPGFHFLQLPPSLLGTRGN